MKGICEFRGKEKELGEGTPFHGHYCAGCLRLNMENDREALKKMREILFRGKRLSDGAWVEGDLSHCIVPGKTNICKIEDNFSTTVHEVDPETVCQYTGLTDRKGRKIFENDICGRKEEFPEIVTYYDGDWTLDYSYVSGKGNGYNYCNLGFYVRNRGGVEIIGNIFDNPELLGEDCGIMGG